MRPKQRPTCFRRDEATAIFVVADDIVAGVLGIADSVKAANAEAIRALPAEGIRVVMLTGDNRTTARRWRDGWGSRRSRRRSYPIKKVRFLRSCDAKERL